MSFLLLLLGFVIGIRILHAIVPNAEEPAEQIFVDKNCPPHKWKFVDIKNQNGEVVGNKIVCQLCGPLKSNDSPRNSGDYS